MSCIYAQNEEHDNVITFHQNYITAIGLIP